MTPRAVRLEFWRASRVGSSYAEAAAAAGVSLSVAMGWVRARGGVMPDVSARTDRYVSLDERQEIQELASQGLSAAEIARRLGRHRCTIGRELARGVRQWSNGRGGTYSHPYLAMVAQARRDVSAERPKKTKLESNPALAAEVIKRLQSWSKPSPEQIAARLRIDFPDDESMRISHETLYTELYVQGRGTLRADLSTCLRTGRAQRKPRRAARRPRVPGELLIANRPKDVDGRCIPGHWEGDLIMGAGNASAVGTLVERRTRFIILLHLPNGHGADQVADAMAAAIGDLPDLIRRSLTWDQGSELVGSHERIAKENNLSVWFCDPASPWQRPTNENSNGLVRQYLPKGTDLSTADAEHLAKIADALNSRPRKTLGWATPAEVMHEILSITKPAVATTP